MRVRVRSADRIALLLDFDGTLVNLQRHPGDVRAPAPLKHVLSCLVQHPKLFVAIVSGRRVRVLRRLLGVKGLHYLGLHGAERSGEPVALAKGTATAVSQMKRSAVAQLGAFPEVWIENKGLSIAVHYRNASPATIRAARETLSRLLIPWGAAFRVLKGSCVWEIVPREIPGKAAAVRKVLRGLPAGIPVVYMGDDGTDEAVFAVLREQITVRVGRRGVTRARYYLRTPGDALRFLERLGTELC